MGLFSQGTCALCGDPVKSMGAIKIAEGVLCKGCGRKAGYFSRSRAKNKTLNDVRADIEAVKIAVARQEAFQPTRTVGKHLAIDEHKQQWQILDGVTGKIKMSQVRDFSEIVSYELLEDGETLAKGGLGRALVGGVLFGGVGAVVGGVTGKKSKNVINSMQIKITVRDMSQPTEYIRLISSKTKHNSFTHRLAQETAQEILSLLELMKELASS